MKPKVVSLALSFAVLVMTATSANAKPISLWKFSNPQEDLGALTNRQSISDWNRIAILSKPYRYKSITLKPFAQWALENISSDLGGSYTPQQSADWNLLTILTKPYR